MIKNAAYFGQHPADMIGSPQTKPSAIWSNWAEVARTCEYEAEDVLRQRARHGGTGKFMGNEGP